jgi:hypothetical protein
LALRGARTARWGDERRIDDGDAAGDPAREITRRGAGVARIHARSYVEPMRTYLVASSLVCAVCAITGCNIGEDEKRSACEEDESLCPVSSRLATDVACDCQCVAGYSGITPTRSFDGEISTCLPPTLNPITASAEQRDMLATLSSTQVNQRVFKFCSENVASYLNDLIEQQQRPRDLRAMCVGPRIRCKCSTKGAQERTAACSVPCADQECDRDNCQPLLKVGGAIDASGCSCSRVNACGSLTPASSDPPLCLNRVAAVLRRRVKQRRWARDAGRVRVPTRPRRSSTI